MNPVPEIRREKIFIPPEMTTKEIKEKYGLSSAKSYNVRKQGFFVKNYSVKQIIIDPENFDPSISYSTAKKVLNSILFQERIQGAKCGGPKHLCFLDSSSIY